MLPMEVLDESLGNYLDDLVPPSPEPARSMEEEARDREFPIVGPRAGRFIKLIARAVAPDQILELGSGFGYSAFWFGEGAPDARITLTDYDEDNLDQAEQYLSETDHPSRFRYRAGEALEVARNLEVPLDLIFIDIDKEAYPEALALAEERLEPGGWIVVDNVLWEGKVTDSDSREPETRGVQQFNRNLFDEPWEASIIPIRDGIALARKESD